MVRESIFFSRKFNVTQLLYYGCHHRWRMPEIQDCNVTFCESFAKVPRELRESWGWDLKGGARSFSRLPHFHTCSLSLSLSYSHSLNLSPHFVNLSQSLSSSLPLSLSLSLSLLLSVCLYLYLSLYLSLSLSLSLCLSLSLSLSLSLFVLPNELVIRIMHGDGSAKVPRKLCFSREVGHFGNKNLGQHPHMVATRTMHHALHAVFKTADV